MKLIVFADKREKGWKKIQTDQKNNEISDEQSNSRTFIKGQIQSKLNQHVPSCHVTLMLHNFQFDLAYF